MGVGVMCRVRGRLPFDGNKQEDIIKMILTKTPDYNNSVFLNLSYNVAAGVRTEA